MHLYSHQEITYDRLNHQIMKKSIDQIAFESNQQMHDLHRYKNAAPKWGGGRKCFARGGSERAGWFARNFFVF
jgi:hypothetical protein